jgi:hypothetical protein
MPALDMSVNTTDKTAITVYVSMNLIYTSFFLGLITLSLGLTANGNPILTAPAAAPGDVPLIARPPFCINLPIFYSSFIIMMGMSGYEFAIINHMRNIKLKKGKKNKSLTTATVFEAVTLAGTLAGVCCSLYNPTRTNILIVSLGIAFVFRIATSIIILSNIKDI